ncbi:kinase-like protein [Lizonia empirigonia]|nr:kinase-like protein [Lizonia empirigonia]
MDLPEYVGSTSQFSCDSSGRIIKSPRKVWTGNPLHKEIEREYAEAIAVEGQILQRLGSHPRIVPFWGVSATGIKLSKASHGNLQAFIDSNNATIDTLLRCKWSLQVVEAVVYAHECDVIHSDLKPENYLVHNTVDPGIGSPPSFDLWLCDFGGSKCDKLKLDRGKLPDDPFFDPRKSWESTKATDIFSLGSIIYTILTGHWPYREGAPPVTPEDIAAYEKEVYNMFMAGQFPDVSKLIGGKVIMGCWDHQYLSSEDVLEALKSEIKLQGIGVPE